ncbi:MAG: helix-turn-helix domain-containing protein [Treponema sp.]|nr:helix-turn-helix domain-containing protein [Treponema sp.]
MSFRENLRFVLDSKGILIKELSLKTGISENTLKSYLKESSAEPSISKALLISEALGVSLEFLATGNEKNNSFLRNPTILEINNYLNKFNNADISAVLSMIKALDEKY